ncbi:MAG: YkgJ family cysteine cluster protein [Phycisphaerales bacterium]|nr:YkgJ family cysteine cluster protein [Phycisphaerales bacterium]
MSVALPVISLSTPGQRYSCHGCGNCCRDFTVQLRQEDRDRLERQGWRARLGTDPVVVFRGSHYLRQREDGSCVFLAQDGRCQVHAEFGFDEKPVACRLFPFMLSPTGSLVRMGVSFACQSVVENKGALVNTQVGEAQRVARGVPEALASAPPAPIARGVPSQRGEVEALERGMVEWIARPLPLSIRLDGLAWMASTLAAARLRLVRGERFVELVGTLCGALQGELPHHPIGVAQDRQKRMLRSAIFARVEDPKLVAGKSSARWRVTLSQVWRNGVWTRGRSHTLVPFVADGWGARASFAEIEAIGRVSDSPEYPACDELVTRWIRCSLEGGRIWGSGYYGWSAVSGLGAHCLSIACTGWLARLHAAQRGAHTPELVDLQAAIRRIDRAAGRAPWLSGISERGRIAYLSRLDGLRRVIAAQY